MKIYAFDVDETLEMSAGPIPMQALMDLKDDGQVVGLCGNWAGVTARAPRWALFLNFIGPMAMPKDLFLRQIKAFVPAEDYIMVGNVLGVSGGSDDKGAAELAGWRFIQEKDFADGAR